MVRIIGTDIPDKKRLEIALTYLHGIGLATSKKIIDELRLDADMPAGKLSESDIATINSHLQDHYEVEGDKRRGVMNNIKRLISIHSYRGMRHRLGLPVRGQKTQKNAKTRKGKSKTIANKKK